MDTLEPPLRWILKQTDLLRNLNDVFCSLLMPQEMDLLLHMDTIRILCFVHYGCLNSRTCCCTRTLLLCIYTRLAICTRLVVEAAVKTIDELYYICVGDARRPNYLCDNSLKCVYVSISIYYVPIW